MAKHIFLLSCREIGRKMLFVICGAILFAIDQRRKEINLILNFNMGWVKNFNLTIARS